MSANFCASCGAENRAGGHFCSKCGAPLTEAAPPPPNPTQLPPTQDQARTPTPPRPQPLRSSEADTPQPDFGLGAKIGISLIVSLALSRIGWSVLGLPAHIIDVAIPDANCASLTPGTPTMYVCSAGVGFVTVIGPLVVVAVALAFKKQLGQGMKATSGALPSRFRFLVAPTMATGLFTMAYAEIHWDTATEAGLVPQRYFPAVAGLLLLLATNLGSLASQKLSSLFDIRDQIPSALRLPLALLVPLLFALVITYQERVTQTALKEQLVILLSLASTYLAVIPRSGDIGDVLKRSPL